MNSLWGGGVEKVGAGSSVRQRAEGNARNRVYRNSLGPQVVSNPPAPPTCETGNASSGRATAPDLSGGDFDDDLDFAEGFRFKYGVDPLGVAADAH